MTTTKLTMTCPECGAETPSWQQRCDSCGALLHEEQRKLNEGQWKWSWITIVLFICIAVALLIYFSNNDESPVVNEEEEGQETVTFVDPVAEQMIDVPEEYASSVNAEITIEELRNSKVVSGMDIYYEGTRYAFANIRILWVQVIDIDKEGRTLTLARSGELPLTLYIGKNAIVIYFSAEGRSGFNDIEKGDGVSIHARLQYGRGDPLYIYDVVVLD